MSTVKLSMIEQEIANRERHEAIRALFKAGEEFNKVVKGIVSNTLQEEKQAFFKCLSRFLSDEPWSFSSMLSTLYLPDTYITDVVREQAKILVGAHYKD